MSAWLALLAALVFWFLFDALVAWCLRPPMPASGDSPMEPAVPDAGPFLRWDADAELALMSWKPKP